MSLSRRLRLGIRRLLRKDAVEQDLDDEVRDYLARATEDYVARGLTHEAAERRARADIGSLESVKEEARGFSTWEAVVETTLRDWRYGLRSLRRAPGFALVTILTLALGIGATTAIFSAVKPILFEPLPYADGNRLMTIWYGAADGSRAPQAFGNVRELETRSRSFAALAAMRPWLPIFNSGDEPERLTGQRVGARYFEVLGVTPALGRTFDAAADRPNGGNDVIISDRIWRTRLAANPAIVGHEIRLDDRTFVVRGVLPATFENVLAPDAEIWSLLQYDPALPPQGREWGHHLRLVGRLSPGATVESARAELERIAREPLTEFPRVRWASMANGLIISALADDVTGAVRPAFTAVMGAVLVMLAIAGVNVTNLLVGRGVRRRPEFAVRSALGAGKLRLARQLFSECLLVAAVGGALGLAVAELGLRELVALSPSGLPRVAAMQLDATAFMFAGGITLAIACLVGVIPALQISRGSTTVQQGSARTSGIQRGTRRILVVAEVALALILLVNAGLLWRSLSLLFAVDPGFNTSQLLTLQVQPSPTPEGRDLNTQFYRNAAAAVRAMPGVSAAAFTSQLPLSGDSDEYGAIFEGDDPNAGRSVFRYAVSDGYFDAIGIPVRRGRAIDARDIAGAPLSAMISESLAKAKFGDRDPVGQRMHIGPTNLPWFTIVGVAGDVRQASLAVDQPEGVYISTEQSWFPESVQSLVVRASGDAAALASPVKNLLRSIERGRAIVRVATMDELMLKGAAERRFVMVIVEVFAIVALLLAAIGLHGVLSSQVAERMKEIGIRSALGASRGAIARLVLGQGIGLTLAGIGIGLVGAVLASRVVVTMLFGVTRLDAMTHMGVIALLVLVAVIASAVPAWRAARVDPVTTLRGE